MNEQSLFEKSIKERNLKYFKYFLKHPEVNPAYNGNDAIRLASYYGYEEIVDILLKDSRVDPTAGLNDPLHEAITFGHYKVVELLLNDKRVVFSNDLNFAIQSAICKNNFEVVRLLFKDKSIKNSFSKDFQEIYKEFISNEMQNNLESF